MPISLTVQGMTCGHCEQTVEAALEAIDGVQDAHADRDAAAATVEGEADPDVLVTAVEDAGYEAAI